MGSKTKRRRRVQHPAGMGPVAMALTKQAVREDLLDLDLRLLSLGEGDDATKVLSDMALPVGLVATVLLQERGLTPDVNLMWGALRTIQSMCVDNGYRWQMSARLSLSTAVEIAKVRFMETTRSPRYTKAYMEAKAYSVSVLHHEVKPGWIAGKETL